MSSFENICRRISNFGPNEQRTLLLAKLDTLSVAVKGNPDICPITAAMIMATVAADGVFADKEMDMIIDAFSFGKEKAWTKAMVKEQFARFLDECPMIKVSNMFTRLPESIRDDIVIVCILFARADGRFDDDEVAWIKDLAF